MNEEIIDITGRASATKCIACSIQRGELQPFGGVIAQSKFFQAEQDYEIPIPGFIVVVSRRHFYGIDEMAQDERHDFIDFTAKIRQALRNELDLQYCHYVLEENTSSSHFHLWIVPRHSWMDDKFGSKIDSVRPAMEYARQMLKNEVGLKEVTEATEKLNAALVVD